MRDWIVIKENIRKQKGVFIGVAILTFIITAVLFAVMGVIVNSQTYIEQQMDRVGYGDVTDYCLDMDEEKIALLEHEILETGVVERIEKRKTIVAKEIMTEHDEMRDSVMLIPYVKDKANSYYIYNQKLSGIEKKPDVLKQGEIYISPSMKSIFDLDIGKKIKITLNKKGEVLELTVKGFFEDPFMGSSLMGMKTILLSEEDIQLLNDLASKTNPWIFSGALLHIYKDKNSNMSMLEFCNLLNKETSVNENHVFIYTKENISAFMTLLQNIFAGILFFFVLVLAVVSIYVVGHSISMGIEQDYMDMGIEKSIGFTSRALKKIQALQYLIVVGIGIVAGTIVSFSLIRIINRALVSISGILVPQELPIAECIGAVILFVLFLLLVITIKVRKIKKISPIKAIRGGISDVHFQSRLSPEIQKKGLPFWMTLRQLTSGKRQYMGVILVSLLLVYILSMVSRINDFIGPDGQGIMLSMGSYIKDGKSYDFGVHSDFVSEEEITRIVKKHTGIQKVMHTVRADGVTINNHHCMVNVCDSPELYQVTEGKSCLYDHEVVVTEIIAQLLSVDVGDKVTLKYGEKELEYTVSGIYQCSNDLGDNYGMSFEGCQKLVNKPLKEDPYYFLTDSKKKEAITEELIKTYGDQISIDFNEWSGLDGLVDSMDAIMLFMYVIVIIFAMITCILSGNRILFRETHDFGIYKSIGYTSKKIRMLFALRFFLASALGSIVGILVSTMTIDSLANSTISSFGLYGFVSHLNVIQLLIPGVFVALMFMVFAYLVARRIKSVSPNILISE